MIDLNNFQSINLSQFFDSVKFWSGSGYHLVIDFCIVMFYTSMILMKFSFVPQTFQNFFFLRSGSGFHYYILKIPTKFGVVPQSFVKIKILFKIKIRIRIRIMILFWISIPDLHFIYRRYPRFVWIRYFLRKLLCPQQKSTYRQSDRKTVRQTYKRNFFACFVF